MKEKEEELCDEENIKIKGFEIKTRKMLKKGSFFQYAVENSWKKSE
jgi:hypothetical protein